MPGRLIFWLLQSTVVLSVYIPHRIASLNTSRYRKRRLRDAADTLVDVFLIREMECIADYLNDPCVHVIQLRVMRCLQMAAELLHNQPIFRIFHSAGNHKC